MLLNVKHVIKCFGIRGFGSQLRSLSTSGKPFETLLKDFFLNNIFGERIYTYQSWGQGWKEKYWFNSIESTESSERSLRWTYVWSLRSYRWVRSRQKHCRYCSDRQWEGIRRSAILLVTFQFKTKYNYLEPKPALTSKKWLTRHSISALVPIFSHIGIGSQELSNQWSQPSMDMRYVF